MQPLHVFAKEITTMHLVYNCLIISCLFQKYLLCEVAILHDGKGLAKVEISSTKVKLSTSAPLFAKPMLAVSAFWVRFYLL
jgi:hypothetical protein